MKKGLPIALTEEERAGMERTRMASEFAKTVIEQCQQQNFTVKQFGKVVSVLDFEYQLLQEHAADTTRM